jgi:photosystem II stability/assembly factor-like uncharacterized protein
MKLLTPILLCFALVYPVTIPTFAQGTAFTFQGRLNDGAVPANGNYDLTFAIYEAAVSGSQQGAMLTNATTVSNGLFAVTLDFGNQFPGGARWLAIGVRTNGGGTFVTLSPRQPLTPAPYAVMAGSASNLLGTLPVAQLSGTITANLLPTTLVTNHAVGLNLSGAFSGNISGNGSGLTNVSGTLSWQIVSGTGQQAQPNTGYLLANSALTTLTLPASPGTGDIVRVSGPGADGWKVAQNAGQSVLAANLAGNIGVTWTARESNRQWQSVAASADGIKLVAVVYLGQIYTSADSGGTWTPRESSRNWYSVAASADGVKLVAVVEGGQIYTSTNSGGTWTPRESNRNWYAVASSANGAKLVALVGAGQIYTSTDSGVTWTPRESSRNWISVASSTDGGKLVAVVQTGQIYTSIDSGVTWTPRDSIRGWQSVAGSADGIKLVAVVYTGQIYTSIDSGVTWTPRENNRNWLSVASSADGTRLVAGVFSGGQIYTSTDSGMTWTPRASNRNWLSVASSADGAKLVAVASGGQIYTSIPISVSSTTPGTTGYLLGNQNSAIELQYLGNGQFLPLSYVGLIQAF